MQLKLIPAVAHVEYRSEWHPLPQRPLVYVSDHPGDLHYTAIKELSATISDKADANIRFQTTGVALGKWAAYVQDPEGYVLDIQPEGIVITASHPAGHLYGAMTLKQLTVQFADQLPCMTIGDKPTFKHRGAQVSLAQGFTAYRQDYFEQLIPLLANWKFNTLYLYLETFIDLPAFPGLAGPGAITRQEIQALEQLCQDYHLELIPMLNLLGHSGDLASLQKYQHLAECSPDKDQRTETRNSLCPSSLEVQQYAIQYMREVMKWFRSDIIHVGGDEVEDLGACSRCQEKVRQSGKLGLYASYFALLQQTAREAGKTIGIWGDMLLHLLSEAPEEQKQAELPKLAGTIIYDWSYFGGSTALKILSEQGFTTIACSYTQLVFTSGMYMKQADRQQALYDDAYTANSLGGLTTAWCNYLGLHEEHYNYLFATTAELLWSGTRLPDGGPVTFGDDFAKTFTLHRYGIDTSSLANYWHAIGDDDGPVLSPLAPLHGPDPRKCLYHTTNVLMMWKQYSTILTETNLAAYQAGIQHARTLWNIVEQEFQCCDDPYLPLQEGPLLMHEHLLKRFEMTEAMYHSYNLAAHAQYGQPTLFAQHLKHAISLLLAHLDDFPAIEQYLNLAHTLVGLENTTMLRLKETQNQIKALAAFLNDLETANRALPSFIQLHNVFLQPLDTNWFMYRQHEWADAPAPFQRYSTQTKVSRDNPFPRKEQ